MRLSAIALASFFAWQPANGSGAIAGIFGDLKYFEESGDLVGTELRVTQDRGRYVVAIIEAEGAPEQEIKVPAVVTGNLITFTVTRPDATIRYTGRITETGFLGSYTVVTNGNAAQKLRLPRRKHSYWQH